MKSNNTDNTSKHVITINVSFGSAKGDVELLFNEGSIFSFKDGYLSVRDGHNVNQLMMAIDSVHKALDLLTGFYAACQEIAINHTVSTNNEVRESYEKTNEEKECLRCNKPTTAIASIFPTELNEPKVPLCEECARELGFNIDDPISSGGSCQHESDNNEERKAGHVCPKGEKGLHGESGKVIDFPGSN